VLGAAREFLESCVRFAIRRRTWLLLFSLIATAIPVIQIWLVVQQNEIIRNQSALLELQVYDIVSRSMTEGDRNARLMTGALLSKADVGFLRGVVEEAFDPNLAGIYREEGVRAQERRLEDAAFRGHLIRAVVRGIENSAEVDRSELFVQTRPMLRLILADAADRVPHVFRLSPGASETDGALAEQVDNYLAQVVRAMQVYARLARTVGEQEAFAVDVRPLLRRLSSHGTTGSGQFEQALGTAFEHFAFEAALELELGDPPVDLDRANLSPDDARRQGLENLRAWVGDEGVAWERLGSIAGDAS
jgi:hypothetical protein